MNVQNQTLVAKMQFVKTFSDPLFANALKELSPIQILRFVALLLFHAKRNKIVLVMLYVIH